MSERAHFALLVQYNEWMNEKLFAAAATLPTEPWLADRGAFFSSIAGTLNHIVAGDSLWLRRFAMHPSRFAVLQPLLAWPAPPSLDAIYSSELPTLRARRRELDAIIGQLVQALGEADLLALVPNV